MSTVWKQNDPFGLSKSGQYSPKEHVPPLMIVTPYIDGKINFFIFYLYVGW